MPLIETTLSVNYQHSEWGVHQAVREIISNAIDGEERGRATGTGKMTIDYRPRSKTFTITNEKTTVPTRALLMGTSESRENESCIGTFGEGLPMALLVLARKGMTVRITNGSEIWKPSIRHSKTFDADVLCVETRQRVTDSELFSVELQDIDPDEAASMQQMFLRLDSDFQAERDSLSAPFSREKVLLGEQYRGKVYNKGVFVTQREDLLFGYDLSEKLNRDRSIIDEYDLKYSINRVLSASVDAHPTTFAKVLIQSLFNKPSALENQGQWGALRYNTAFRDAVLAEWSVYYGDKTVAVSSVEEVRQADLLGLKAVVAPPLLMSMISDALGSFSSLRDTMANEVTGRLGMDELSSAERKTFDVVGRVFSNLLTVESMKVTPVNFVLSSTMSDNKGGELCLNRVLFADATEAVKAVAMEIAKVRAGRRGTRAADEQVNILATLVATEGSFA